MKRVVVVGGGVAGLAAAHYLAAARPRADLDVRLIEASPHPGGKTRTIREGGCVLEWGPHGILDNAPLTMDLIAELGLSARLLLSRDEARRRHVLYAGRLQDVPASPRGLLASGLLPLSGKLRLFLEPFVRARAPAEESVADFAARRLGKAVIAPLLEPFVTGIYAGDVRALSLRSCFPLLNELERDHGGLLRGMMARAKQRKARGEARRLPALCSFKSGLGELTEALMRSLGESYLGETRVRALKRQGSGYFLELTGKGPQSLAADALVLALPVDAARGLVEPLDAELAAALAAIPLAGIAVVCATFPRERVRHPLDSFGFLCARGEGRRILGCIFASSVFSGHAPPGLVSLRALLGGVFSPEIARAPEESIAGAALADLDDLLGLRGEPERLRVFRHERALPQYNLGHAERLAAIERALTRHPGLFLAGAGYSGVSVNDCVRSGRNTAEKVLCQLLAAG
ncbi:MAG: protoporphyrinogen oxidase [Planctomycetes bacterium]|nr:protoporphyrinogen oxidase [Planctomycetota bacterium]